MRTEQLIDALARGAGPAPRFVVARRFVPVMVAGFALSAAVAISVLGRSPEVAALSTALWAKVLYAVGLAASTAWLAGRWSRPAAGGGPATCAVALVVIAMVATGASALMTGAPAERDVLVFGRSWAMCPWAILALSMPTLAGLLWGIRGLAPIRYAHAGFAAGALAGAVGALGYAFACTETSIAFVAIWYSLGIVACGSVGALLGHRVLRW